MWKLEFVIFKIFPEKFKQSISPNPGEVFTLESRGGATRGRLGNLQKKKTPAHPPEISGTTLVKNMKIRLCNIQQKQ